MILAYLAQSVRRSFSPSGRSGRTEVWAYLLAATLIGVLFSAITAWFLAPARSRWALLAVTLFIAIPAVSLVIRRFHDLDRSGWWSLALALGAVRLLLLEILQGSLGWDARATVERLFTWVDWAVFPAFGLAYIVIIAWPGTKRENRFGPPVHLNRVQQEQLP